MKAVIKDEDGWLEYQKMVLSKLEELGKGYDALNTKISEISIELAVQGEKVKNVSGRISLFVSAVVSVAVGVILKITGGG